jgi:hypothetical protein
MFTAWSASEVFPVVKELVSSGPALPGWRLTALKPPRGFGFTINVDGCEIAASRISFQLLESEAMPERSRCASSSIPRWPRAQTSRRSCGPSSRPESAKRRSSRSFTCRPCLGPRRRRIRSRSSRWVTTSLGDQKPASKREPLAGNSAHGRPTPDTPLLVTTLRTFATAAGRRRGLVMPSAPAQSPRLRYIHVQSERHREPTLRASYRAAWPHLIRDSRGRAMKIEIQRRAEVAFRSLGDSIRSVSTAL